MKLGRRGKKENSKVSTQRKGERARNFEEEEEEVVRNQKNRTRRARPRGRKVLEAVINYEKS